MNDLPAMLREALGGAGVREQDGLGVAVSGGADSTALLHLLVADSLRVHVLHVDHGLRAGSAEDARAVAQMSETLGVPATVLRVEVEDRPQVSIEAAARDARYTALERAADELGLGWVATAHTLDDQAETVLLRAMRGTGVGGLAGIRAVRGRFVRPLLGVRRSLLRTWLTERGIGWIEDPTNADLTRERNWVRNELLPSLEGRRSGVAHTLARLADHARRDAATLDALAGDVFSRARPLAGGLVLPDTLLDVPDAIATRVVLRALREMGATAEEGTVRAVLATESRVSCGGGTSAWRLHDAIAMLPDPVPVPAPVTLPADGSADLPGWGLRVGVPSCEARWTMRAPAGMLRIRSRRSGDRVGRHKVADVLRDAGVPSPMRDLVPVLCAGDQPVAVVGFSTPPVGSDRSMDVAFDPLPESLAEETWWSRRVTPAIS